jgi:hypothetical protein
MTITWKIKIFFILTLFFLLIHTIYWSIPTLELVFLDFPGNYFSNAISALGSVVRIIGILLGLFLVYLAWGPSNKLFTEIKGKISLALFLEGIYYLTFIPTAILLINEFSVLQGALYSLFTLLMTPSLVILVLKVKNNQGSLNNSVFIWIGATCLAYLTALWITIIANWLDSILKLGFLIVVTETSMVSFLNSTITLSIALVFALMGLFPLIKKGSVNTSVKRWGALSMIFVGIYFSILTIHALLTATVDSALIGDIWLIPLLAIGIILLMTKKLM